MYNAMVNDGEWEGKAGQPPKRVVEHFGYADLATIDNQQRDSAITYIKDHAKDDKPFFMYVAFLKVHQPNNPAPEFKGKSHESNYLDSLMELDSNSGRIVQAIRDAGLDQDTIVVWTTDNGPWIDAWPDAGYTPFRGMKGSGFEGGWRVPGIMWAPGRIQPGSVFHGMMSHMDVWPTLATMAGLKPPPHGEWKDNNGKPIYFDGMDNSAYITGKAEESARISWVYIDAVNFLGVRYGEWKFLFTAKDTWLGPDLHLGIPAIYNLKQDPAEHYDMTFNGAAAPTAGVLKSSPGRYSGADNGWAGVFSMIPLNEFIDSIKKYPNIPTSPAGSSMGADLPEFIPPNLAPQK